MSYLKQDKVNPKRWMKDELRWNARDYSDCGEINTTKLAENCADCLNLYVDEASENYDIPEEIFDLAFEVAEEFLND